MNSLTLWSLLVANGVYRFSQFDVELAKVGDLAIAARVYRTNSKSLERGIGVGVKFG
jgi:hypothetical protein